MMKLSFITEGSNSVPALTARRAWMAARKVCLNGEFWSETINRGGIRRGALFGRIYKRGELLVKTTRLLLEAEGRDFCIKGFQTDVENACGQILIPGSSLENLGNVDFFHFAKR